jgi:hypothetical protein
MITWLKKLLTRKPKSAVSAGTKLQRNYNRATRKWNRLRSLKRRSPSRTFRRKLSNLLARGYYGAKRLFNKKTMSARIASANRKRARILAQHGQIQLMKGLQRATSGRSRKTPSPRRPSSAAQRALGVNSPKALPRLKLPTPKGTPMARPSTAALRALGMNSP